MSPLKRSAPSSFDDHASKRNYYAGSTSATDTRPEGRTVPDFGSVFNNLESILGTVNELVQQIPSTSDRLIKIAGLLVSE